MNTKDIAGPRSQSDTVLSTTPITATPTRVPICRLALSTDPATFAFSAPAASTRAAVIPGEMTPAPMLAVPTATASTQYGVDDDTLIMVSDATPAISRKSVSNVPLENRAEIRE